MAAFLNRPRLSKFFASASVLVFSATCNSQTDGDSQLELKLSTDTVKATQGQTVDVQVTLHSTVALDAPVVLSLRSPGDQPLPMGLNAAFDPTALSPGAGETKSAKLHLLPLSLNSAENYPLIVYGRSKDHEVTAALNLTLTGDNSTWQRPIMTAGTDQVPALISDGSDGVFAAVNTTAALADRKNQGDFDAYVVHYRQNGAVSFVAPFATASTDVITALATDANGNVYIGGYTYGVFPGQSSTGKADGFVAKVGSDGTLAWLSQLGTSEVDQLTGIAVAPDGAVYVAGLTDGAFPGQTNAGSSDVFVGRFLPGGSIDWISQFGTDQPERSQNLVTNEAGVGITVDGSGNVFVCGSTMGVFPGAMQQGVNTADAYVARLTSVGKPMWLKQFGTTFDDALLTIAPHANGTIYAAGFTRGVIAGQVQQGGYDGLLVAYKADGTQTLVRQFGTSYTDSVNNIFVGADRIYLVGNTRGAFPGQTQNGIQDIFYARMSLDGSTQWMRQFGTSQLDIGNAITQAGDNLYLGGTTYGTFASDMMMADSDGLIYQYKAE